MITYYTEQEFEKVVIDTIVSAIIEQKADIEKELSCVYFVEKRICHKRESDSENQF